MTSWLGWAVRCARASTGLLLTLLALVTVTTAILAGAVGYSSAAATTAARQALTGTVPSEAGIRVQTRQGPDPQAQDAAARDRIVAAFDPAPVSVQTTLVSEPRPVTRDGTALDGRVVVVGSASLTPDDPDATDRVQVVEGTWPTQGTDPAAGTDPAEGMLHAATAQEWGVAVGDTLEVDGTPVRVVGTWRPVDAANPYWFGDRLVAAGTDGRDRGPLVVAPAVVGALVEAPFVRWTVQPDATSIQPDDLPLLADAAASLQSSLKVPEIDVRGVTVDGDLAPTAATASTNLATARALGVIPLSVLVLVTMLAVVQLARLLATTREAQAALLVARGATRAQVLGGTVAESALVALLGTALGGAVAWGVLQAVPAGEAQAPTVLRVAALTGLGVLAVLTAVAVLQVRRLTSTDAGETDRSGRTRAATALATVVLVLGAAGVAWWQLRRTGSPVITRTDGTLGTDLVAGAAPALLLAAAAVVAMALLGPAGRLVEALTRPGRGATGHLAAAQVSRRLTVYAVPAVLTVLAVGATTVSGLYAGTSAHLRDNLAAVGQGAPVRAALVAPPATTEPGVVTPPPATLTDVDGVERNAPVWTDPNARLADLTVPLTMAPLDQLAAVVTTPDLPAGAAPMVPVDALRPAASGEVSGLPLPEATRTVEVTLEAELTVRDRALDSLQEGYEALVQELMGEAEDTDNLVRPDPDPLPEDEAREVARGMTDAPLTAAAGDPTVASSVELTFLDPETGLVDTVASAPIEIRRATVRPPPAPAPYTESEVTDGGGGGTVTFTLPEGTRQVLRDVRLLMPLTPTNRFDPVSQDVRVTVTATLDGSTPLLGEATADWGSTDAAPPDVVAEARREAEEQQGSGPITVVDPSGRVIAYHDTGYIPPLLDVSGSTWVVEGRAGTNLPTQLVVAPGVTYQPPAAPGTPPGQAPTSSDQPVPVALTPAAARAANLEVGSPAQMRAFGTVVPVTVAAIVPAVPGTLAPQAAIADRDAVAAVLERVDRPLPYPHEAWLTTAPGQEPQVVEALAGRADVSSVTGPGGVQITDATSAARLVFWVASAGAVLLAATGVAAVTATLLGARRPEVAVLRALGMPPRAQARSRAFELGGVVLASVLLGLAAGWLVARAVVPELARSTTQRGQVTLAAPLQLEVGPWAVLLVAGAVVVAAVLLAQAARVARQALDTDYREEIR